jgi:hypothetical protein
MCITVKMNLLNDGFDLKTILFKSQSIFFNYFTDIPILILAH